MGKVIAADAVAIAVAAGDDDVQIMVGQLGPGSHCQGAAVERMHPVAVKIPGQIGRAADAADREYFVGLQSQTGAGPLQTV